MAEADPHTFKIHETNDLFVIYIWTRTHNAQYSKLCVCVCVCVCVIHTHARASDCGYYDAEGDEDCYATCGYFCESSLKFNE